LARSSSDRNAELAFLLTAFAAAYCFCELRFLLADPFSGPALFDEVSRHTGPKPWQYRVLIPYAAGILSHLNLPPFFSLERWAKLAELSSLFLLVLAFRRYISLFIRDRAVASLFSFLILLILPFNFFFPRPHYPNYWYDTPSMLFFTLGLILLHQKKWLPYYGVFVIATFNRETTCFLTFIYLLTSAGRVRPKRIAFHCVSQFVLWLTIKSLLVKLYAGNPGPSFEWYAHPGATHFADNIAFFTHPENYPMFLSNMGFTWVAVLLHLRRIKVEFVKRSLLVVLPFFAGMMLVANIYELRLFGELIPVVLAAFVLVFHDLLRRPEGGPAAHAEVEKR
jgi:hypothetical protein